MPGGGGLTMIPGIAMPIGGGAGVGIILTITGGPGIIGRIIIGHGIVRGMAEGPITATADTVMAGDFMRDRYTAVA